MESKSILGKFLTNGLLHDGAIEVLRARIVAAVPANCAFLCQIKHGDDCCQVICTCWPTISIQVKQLPGQVR